MTGWMEKRRSQKRERAQQMNMEARDVINIVESPYVSANKHLSEYEKDVRFKPNSAYRHAKRGYSSAVMESEAAKIHSQAYDMLYAQKRMEERHISNMEQGYREAIASGNIRKAGKIAQKMMREAHSSKDTCPVHIDMDDLSSDEYVEVIVVNRGDTPLIINSLTCSSGTTELSVEKGMSMALPVNDSMKKRIEFHGEKSMEVSVSVEYEQGLETHRINKHFQLRKRV